MVAQRRINGSPLMEILELIGLQVDMLAHCDLLMIQNFF
jgi:hypothetical protein